jgi:glycerophosphoryl diester phosphodiesterase
LRELRVLGERIPTLDEVLAVSASKATIYVEIKGFDIEDAVVASICRSPARERCAVHSFNHQAVRRVRELAPEIPTGILLSSYLADPTHALSCVGARDYWQNWEFVDAELADAVHNVGGRLIAWTPFDAHDLLELAADGVDGVCVNDPARAIDIFERNL